MRSIKFSLALTPVHSKVSCIALFISSHQTQNKCYTGIDVFADNPHAQENLQTISSLNKHSRVTSMEWGDEDEILVGRANKFLKVYNASDNEFTSTIELDDGPIIGAGRYDGKIIAGLASGKVQIFQQKPEFLQTGDHLSRMRQCKENRKLFATGGKGRQNNLKLWDLETKTKVFTSKNLPNDYLELEGTIPYLPTLERRCFLNIFFLSSHCSACVGFGYCILRPSSVGHLLETRIHQSVRHA